MNHYYLFTYTLKIGKKTTLVEARVVSDRTMTDDLMISRLKNEHGGRSDIIITSPLHELTEEQYNNLFFPLFDKTPIGDSDILEEIKE